jgi:hypothetical protein
VEDAAKPDGVLEEAVDVGLVKGLSPQAPSQFYLAFFIKLNKK